MRQLIDYLLDNSTVPEEMIILLLTLPVIVTLIGIARYYIGIKTFSLYAPILLSTGFYIIAYNYTGEDSSKVIAGLLYGLLFIFISISASIVVHTLFKRIRMHYFPKTSLIISTVAIIVFMSLVILQYLNILELTDVSMIGLILITVVSELFLNKFVKKSFSVSIKLTSETIILSTLCYLMIILEPFQRILLNYPEIVLAAIPINYLVGRYTGLRIMEYFRFQDIMSKQEQKE